MSSGGFLLTKDRKDYDPVIRLESFARIAYNIKCMFHYNNSRCGNSLNMNFIDSKSSINEFNYNQILLNLEETLVHTIDSEKGEIYWDVCYIEIIEDENSKLLFDFVHEYLRLYPNEYFWNEWDSKWKLLFGWNEMQLLKQRPFDKEWYCKKL